MTRPGGTPASVIPRLLMRLLVWAESARRLDRSDKSGGFRLPEEPSLSPDAALLRLERWQASLCRNSAKDSRPSAPIWW